MYDASIRETVLERIAAGESLRDIAKSDGMPQKATLMRWASEDAEFRDQYARAMLVRADLKFLELDDVAEEAVEAETAVKVQGLRLKADNIKWMLGKMNPKKYGDRLDLNHSGAVKYEKIERVVIGANPDT
jgi:hypothetical protein